MRTIKSRGRNWPMNRILGGVFLLGLAVLLAAGLQSGGEERTEAAAPAAAREPAPRSLPEPAGRVEPAATEPSTVAAVEPQPEPEPEPDPDPAPTFAAAEASYRAADYDLASERFERYSRAHPDNPWGYYMLGLSEWKRGGLDAAEAALSRSLELDAEFERARLNLSRVLLAASRPDEALSLLRAEPELASAEALRLRGRALHSLGRADEAIAAYDAALLRDPGDAWALNNLGLVLIQSERFEDARAALALAVELDGGQPLFRNNLGIALERCGDAGLAAELYGSALELDAEYEKAAGNLARVAALAAADGEAPDLAQIAATTAAALAAGRCPWTPAAADEELTDAETAPGETASLMP